MRTSDKQKQSLYFPEETLREITKEANRLDRSLSWTMQQAWRLAREEIKRFPSSDQHGEVPRAATLPVRERPASPPPRADLTSAEPSAQVREFLRGKFDRELTS